MNQYNLVFSTSPKQRRSHQISRYFYHCKRVVSVKEHHIVHFSVYVKYRIIMIRNNPISFDSLSTVFVKISSINVAVLPTSLVGLLINGMYSLEKTHHKISEFGKYAFHWWANLCYTPLIGRALPFLQSFFFQKVNKLSWELLHMITRCPVNHTNTNISISIPTFLSISMNLVSETSLNTLTSFRTMQPI